MLSDSQNETKCLLELLGAAMNHSDQTERKQTKKAHGMLLFYTLDAKNRLKDLFEPLYLEGIYVKYISDSFRHSKQLCDKSEEEDKLQRTKVKCVGQ